MKFPTMKFSTILLPTAFLLPYVLAFPSYAGLEDRSGNLEKRQQQFDPVRQKVDITGNHIFKAPGVNDLRGPCPGLNVLANHGYIQRNGVTSLLEVLSAAQNVFGFAVDLAIGLGTFGVVFAGDPITQKFSIGGPPPQTPLEQLTSILFGRPRGLSGSHNTYETDSSATRGDSYLYNGDVSTLRLEYLQDILDRSGGVDDYTPRHIWTEHRKVRFEHSVANNPYFFFGPISGVLISEAGTILMREVFANHSAAGPVLPRSVLLSFLGVTENSSGQLTVNVGHERIPDNWYRRSPDFPLTVPDFLLQVAELIALYPRAASVGGNTGTVNSFVGLDLGDLTGGVFHSGDLADPAKLSCFLYRVSQILVPTVLHSLYVDTVAALGLVNNWFGLFAGLDCPVLQTIDESMFAQFPGATPGMFT